LYRAIAPFSSFFLMNVHLFPIGSLHSGKSTSSHVPIILRVFSSSNMASFHCDHSADSFAASSDFGSSSSVGLVMSNGSGWGHRAGRVLGLFNVW
jgi:hypothetical protein